MRRGKFKLRTLLFIAALLCLETAVQAADKLVIISPHRKSIQEEYIPTFKTFYKQKYGTDVDVEWIDQGGTSDDVRFLRAKFAKNPKTADVDIFWGGGTPTYVELDRDKLLASYSLSKELQKEIPATCAGVPLYNKEKTWYASAISSFGIFYNKKVLKLENIPEPKTWNDLTDPKFRNHLTLADPRRSGSANSLNTIILQSQGWEKGWETLTKIAGNTRQFTHSSSDPIKAVVSGEAIASMAIDFYALAKVGDLGSDNLGFILPAGQTILDPDPIALVKGAPNAKVAGRFIEYVLGNEGQKILILPKGAPGGPVKESLGRLAINTRSYDETEGKRIQTMNPFKEKAFMKMDIEKAGRMKRVFDDLLGAVNVDTHADLKAAWEAVVKAGAKPEAVAALGKPFATESEVLSLADKWSDDVQRNKVINTWVEAAKKRYQALANGQKAG